MHKDQVIEAVKNHQIEPLQLLLSQHPDIVLEDLQERDVIHEDFDKINKNKMILLEIACQSGNADIIMMVINKTAEYIDNSESSAIKKFSDLSCVAEDNYDGYELIVRIFRNKHLDWYDKYNIIKKILLNCVFGERTSKNIYHYIYGQNSDFFRLIDSDDLQTLRKQLFGELPPPTKEITTTTSDVSGKEQLKSNMPEDMQISSSQAVITHDAAPTSSTSSSSADSIKLSTNSSIIPALRSVTSSPSSASTTNDSIQLIVQEFEDRKLAELVQEEELSKIKKTVIILNNSSVAMDSAIKKGLGINLNEIIPLQPGISLGKAVDDGGCFFDALAQLLNQRDSVDFFNEKYLRMLCHEYFQKNKDIVNEWNKKDNHGKDVGDKYNAVQYTRSEMEGDKNLNQGEYFWGRPHIEGVILCRKLQQIPQILVIEIIFDEGSNIWTRGYLLINADGEKPLSDTDGDKLANDKSTLTIVNKQGEVHFVPLLKDKAIPEKKEDQKIKQEIKAQSKPEHKPTEPLLKANLINWADEEEEDAIITDAVDYFKNDNDFNAEDSDAYLDEDSAKQSDIEEDDEADEDDTNEDDTNNVEKKEKILEKEEGEDEDEDEKKDEKKDDSSTLGKHPNFMFNEKQKYDVSTQRAFLKKLKTSTWNVNEFTQAIEAGKVSLIAQDNEGKYPLQIALESNNLEAVKYIDKILLKDYGEQYNAQWSKINDAKLITQIKCNKLPVLKYKTLGELCQFFIVNVDKLGNSKYDQFVLSHYSKQHNVSGWLIGEHAERGREAKKTFKNEVAHQHQIDSKINEKYFSVKSKSKTKEKYLILPHLKQHEQAVNEVNQIYDDIISFIVERKSPKSEQQPEKQNTQNKL